MKCRKRFSFRYLALGDMGQSEALFSFILQHEKTLIFTDFTERVKGHRGIGK